MNNIRYFKLRDAQQLVRMIGAEWDLAKRATRAGRLCDWIYCAEILAVNTDMLVLTANNGRPIGFAGYSQKNARRHVFRRIVWRTVHFVFSLAVRNRGALREYYDVYNYAPADIARQFDAECDILIVDKCHRGWIIAWQTILFYSRNISKRVEYHCVLNRVTSFSRFFRCSMLIINA